MFIVLEGGDGTGKSIQVNLVANALGGVAYGTPPGEYRKQARNVKRDATPEQQYEFFKSGIVAASAEINNLLSEGKTVVCDRYWITTLVYHQVMGLQVNTDDFADTAVPDVTFLLTAAPLKQKQRMLDRGLDAGDELMFEKQLDIAARYFRALTTHNLPFFSVDTSTLTIEQTTEVICMIARKVM